eukprot:5713349-Alexandrium_andersonii.AAC.1
MASHGQRKYTCFDCQPRAAHPCLEICEQPPLARASAPYHTDHRLPRSIVSTSNHRQHEQPLHRQHVQPPSARAATLPPARAAT